MVNEQQMGVLLAALLNDCWKDRERRLLIYLAQAGGSVEISTVYDWKRSGMHYTNASKAAQRLVGLGILARVGTTTRIVFERLQDAAAPFVVLTNLGVHFVKSTKAPPGKPVEKKAICRFDKSSTAEPPSHSPGLDSKESKHTQEQNQRATGSSGSRKAAPGPANRPGVCVSPSAPKPKTGNQSPSPTIGKLSIAELRALGLHVEVATAAKAWPIWNGFRVVQLQRLQATRHVGSLAAGLDVVGWQANQGKTRIGNPAAYLAAVLEKISAGSFIRPAGYSSPAERAAAAAAAAERDTRLNQANAEIERQQEAQKTMAVGIIAKLTDQQFVELRRKAEKECREEVGEGPEIPEIFVRATMERLALEEAHAAP